jgi:hypothetical protein
MIEKLLSRKRSSFGEIIYNDDTFPLLKHLKTSLGFCGKPKMTKVINIIIWPKSAILLLLSSHLLRRPRPRPPLLLHRNSLAPPPDLPDISCPLYHCLDLLLEFSFMKICLHPINGGVNLDNPIIRGEDRVTDEVQVLMKGLHRQG